MEDRGHVTPKSVVSLFFPPLFDSKGQFGSKDGDCKVMTIMMTFLTVQYVTWTNGSKPSVSLREFK